MRHTAEAIWRSMREAGGGCSKSSAQGQSPRLTSFCMKAFGRCRDGITERRFMARLCAGPCWCLKEIAEDSLLGQEQI